jgi:hypothetical protein
MIDIFGNDLELKQAVRYGKKLPGYYLIKDGKVYSSKTNKFISLYPGKGGYIHCSLSLPIDIFEDHCYFKTSFKRKSFNLQQQVHRLVAETFIPIDENPPIPVEDWKNTPETAKQFIRDSAVVDHVIPDLTNNSVENLRWITPKGNNPHRKEQKSNICV